MEQVMIDLETMGTGNDAAIIAIGAVKFVVDGQEAQILDRFYRVIKLSSAVSMGGKISPDTVLWWLQQSSNARNSLLNELSCNMLQALNDFSVWFGKDKPIWGNGAVFDNVILKSAFDRSEANVPWTYRSDRCYRTIKAMFPQIPFQPSDDAIAHHALHDAEQQAIHLIEILKHINKKEEVTQ